MVGRFYVRLSLLFMFGAQVGAAARNCTVRPATAILSKSVIVENNIGSAQQCAEACEDNSACCAGEFEPPKHAGWKPHCFLLSNVTLKPDPTASTSAIVCTPDCSSPPPPSPSPSPATVQHVVAPKVAVPVNGIVEWTMDIEGLLF